MTSPDPIPPPTTNRVAVLVRSTGGGDKLHHLLAQLRSGLGYDLFVCDDETERPLPPDDRLPAGVRVLRHAPADMAELGLLDSLPDTRLLWFFGDYAFYASYAALPGYAHYVLLDERIAFARDNPLFLEGLVHRLDGDTAGPFDLVASWLGERPPEWSWHAAAAARFAAVHGIFTPLVVLSQRALEFLLTWRRREAAEATAAPVFWEALVPSALIGAGGYRCADLNSLLPGSWAPTSFPASAPMLLGAPSPRDTELLWPVASERAYMAWLLEECRANGDIADLVGRLAPGGDIDVSPPVREWFLREALRSFPHATVLS